MIALKTLFTLALFSSLSLVNNQLSAAEKNLILGDDRGSTYSYNPGSFCSSSAEDIMNDLNEINKAKFDKIKSYKEELKNLAIYDNLLTQAKTIKNRYEASLKQIADPTNNSQERAEKLGHVRSVLKNALTINALSLLIKKQQRKVNVPEVLTMDSLCQGNEDEAICQNKSLGKKNNLDDILKGFQNLANELPDADQAKLKIEIKKVIADIPKEISPNEILDLLSKDSPTLSELLTNANSKTLVSNCLNETADQKSLNACGKIIGSVKTQKERQVLLETVSKESIALTGDLQKYNKVLAAAVEENKSDLEKALESYDATKDSKSNSKLIFTDASKLLNRASTVIDELNAQKKLSIENLQSSGRNPASISNDQEIKESIEMNETRLEGVENFFYEKPTPELLKARGLSISNPADADKIKGIQEQSIIKAKKEAEQFKTACNFSEESSNDDAKLKQCKTLMEKVFPQIEAAGSQQAIKIQKITQELKDLSDKDFKDTENLKEYVAEKYLCACEKNKKTTTTDENLQLRTCDAPLMTLSKLDGLTKSTGIIAETLYFNKIKMPMDQGKCAFDPKELEKFSESCKNTSVNTKFSKQVCASVNAEIQVKEEVKTENIKRNRKLDKLNEENYVTYDRNSPSGYSVTKKKSTGRIIAEGMAPGIPMLLPAFLGNWQMKMNIDMMTNQALYQKQMLHNYDVYNNSPWMYGYNYFGLSPYSTTGTTTSTSTTLPTTNIGAGFNFGL
jgi:hypothetical protein